VRQRGRSINVCLAAEELIVVASPAIVDAACLFLSRFHKLGHDRLSHRPVTHGERRLDCHDSLWDLWGSRVLHHATEAGVDREVLGAEPVHLLLTLLDLGGWAVQLDLVERRRRLE